MPDDPTNSRPVPPENLQRTDGRPPRPAGAPVPPEGVGEAAGASATQSAPVAPATVSQPVPPVPSEVQANQTVPGVAQASPAPARQPMPKRRKLIIAVAVAVVAVVVVVAGVWSFGAGNARTEIASASSDLSSVDDSLSEVALVYSGSLSYTYTSDYASALDGADDSLDSAAAHLAKAQGGSGFLDDAGREALSALSSSIDSRRTMVASLRNICEESDASLDAMTDLSTVSYYASEALSSLNEAVGYANSNDFDASGSSASDATDRIDKALDALKGVESDYAGPDYSSYDSYLSALNDVIGIASQVDDAAISGDATSASSLIDQYNTQSDTLDAQLDSLPDIYTFVNDYVDEKNAKDTDSFEEALASSTASDKTLNGYVGSFLDVSSSLSAASHGYGSSSSSNA